MMINSIFNTKVLRNLIWSHSGHFSLTRRFVFEPNVGILSLGRGKTKVSLVYFKSAVGIVAHLFGGRPHIGSASVSFRKMRYTLAFPGHKEHILTRKCCSLLSKKFTSPILITAGIHYNNLTKNQIASILANSRKLTHKLESI